MVAFQREPLDHETALRLVHPSWIKENGSISSAAFRVRAGVSLFIEDRLPHRDATLLQVDRFAKFALAALGVGSVRATTFYSAGLLVEHAFDMTMTPNEVASPFEAFAEAHASLTGPFLKPAGAAAVAAQFNRLGRMLPALA